MLGLEVTTPAVPAAGALHAPASRPPPETRTVEPTTEAPRRQAATPRTAQPSPALDDLIASARAFANLLDATGSVQLASTLSGFQPGGLDLYV